MKRSAIDSLLQDNFDEYEVAIIRETSRKQEVRDKEIYGAELKAEEGMSLRAIRDNKGVFTYTFAQGEEGLRRLVANAGELLPFMERDEDLGFPQASGDLPGLSVHDDEGLRIQDREKISKLLEMESLILNYDRRIRKTRNCEYSETELFVRIVNSRGIDVEARKTVYTLFGLAVAADGKDDEVSCYDWDWSHRFTDLNFAALAEDIGRKTVASLGAATLSTGTFEGIVTPRAAADLLQVLSASFLAESRHKRKTKLVDREGQECFSPLVTIVDSGLVGIDAFPFDGEGVPSGENIIVDRGIFMGFLYDAYYGTKFGRTSSGNSTRGGITAPPQNGIRGIYIREGKSNILQSMTDGIIIDDLMGIHTANSITGEFSVGATGWLRKGGEDRPFKGVVFSGNIFELLKQVRAVGNDLRFFGSVGSPCIFVEGLRISGT